MLQIELQNFQKKSNIYVSRASKEKVYLACFLHNKCDKQHNKIQANKFEKSE